MDDHRKQPESLSQGQGQQAGLPWRPPWCHGVGGHHAPTAGWASSCQQGGWSRNLKVRTSGNCGGDGGLTVAGGHQTRPAFSQAQPGWRSRNASPAMGVEGLAKERRRCDAIASVYPLDLVTMGAGIRGLSFTISK